MAVFLLKTLLGAHYTPPTATGTVFADVSADSFAADCIEDLAASASVSGRLPREPAPVLPDELDDPRATMAIFLVKTFGLPCSAPARLDALC